MFFSSIVWAAETDLSAFTDIKAPTQTAEYIFRTSPRDSLISVSLFGAVTKPGIYYVPKNTDLLKLLTLAGGATPLGSLDEVVVRKSDKAWDQVKSHNVSKNRQGAYELDLDTLIRKEGTLASLQMSQDDFVYIPQKQPWISNDVSRTVSVISIVLGTALTVMLLQQKIDSK